MIKFVIKIQSLLNYLYIEFEWYLLGVYTRKPFTLGRGKDVVQHDGGPLPWIDHPFW